MKTYKVRIKKAPMKMGGVARYQEGGSASELTPEEEAMMLYGSEPTAGSLQGSVDLGAMDVNYPINLPVTGPGNAMPSKYAGSSVYDYLASQGQKADYVSRKDLAKAMGIKNYKGTAAQNLAMLDMLRGELPSNTTSSNNRTSSSSRLPNGRNQQGKVDAQVKEVSPEDYNAWDSDGNFKYSGKMHPRFEQVIGANYHPAYDARHQPWSPNYGLSESELQDIDNNQYYNKSKSKPGNKKHSMLNNITNALTGARSYEEYAKKNPYFFNFLGVDDNSSAFVKGLDAIPHHVENALAKLTYDGDPASALEIAALIATKGLRRGIKPNALPPGPNPRLLTQPPKGGFTMPGKGGLGNFTYEYGGQPAEMAYGGQIGWGLDLNSKRSYTDMPTGKQDNVGRTLGPVDSDEATYEAERGEVIIGDFDKDGNHETLTFGGKPHSKGGTPAKEEGFIYSKTKNMALGGPIISEFGKTPGKKYTPADLAKQYDLTKYKAVLDDKNADPLAKRTAELMTEAYKKKLGKLAFVQESVKGFPQGVPQIAMETYPELAEKVMGQQESEEQEMPNEEAEYARYGGYYQNGGNTKRFSVMDKEELAYLNSLNNGRSQVVMPVNAKDPNRFTIPSMQNKNASKVYGDENWWDAENQADFRKRHAWFTDNAPGWDPRIPGATKAFQLAYNDRLKSLGYNPYFSGKGHKAVDDMFGEGTFSAPGFEDIRSDLNRIPTPPPKKIPIPITPPAITYKPNPGEIPKWIDTGKPKTNLPYNRFDVANLMMAAATPVKSYAPRMFQPDMQEMQGYYDQPDYNAMLSAANTRAQMNNTFSNAPAAMAANSYNPDLTQGILQETQRARANNIQTANQLSQANTQIRNQANMMNAQLQQDNYDKWIKTQEETDIANKLKWRKDVMPAAQNMVNNRIQMNRLNMMYPEYAMTGPYWDQTEFQGGYDRGANPSTSGYGNVTFEQFLATNPHLKDIYSKADKDDSKIKIHQMYQQYMNQRSSMYGKNSRNLSANITNPYLAQLLGTQGGYSGDPSLYE